MPAYTRAYLGRQKHPTKPYKFIGFWAMDVTKPYKFIGFGAVDAPLPEHQAQPNAKRDPNRSESHLIVGDYRVGGAFVRRGHPPEPEQIAFDRSAPQRGPESYQATIPRTNKGASRLGRTPILQKRPKMMKRNLF